MEYPLTKKYTIMNLLECVLILVLMEYPLTKKYTIMNLLECVLILVLMEYPLTIVLLQLELVHKLS